MIRIRSLRGRLLSAMLAVFALGLLASLASFRFEIHNLVNNLHERTLQSQARTLLAGLQRRGGRLQVQLPPDWQRVYRDSSRQFLYTVFDAGHRAVAWSPNLAAPLRYAPVRAPGTLGTVQLLGVGARQGAMLAARIPGGGSLLVERRDLAHATLIDSLFEEENEHMLVLVPFALLGLVLIWLITDWSLRPIARASREAALAGPSRPDLRISVQDLPREIQPLVEAVNGALDRLSRAYSSERRLTADAAHELRTPLAVLNLRLQRARLSGTADWAAVGRELEIMGRLVDQLLDLARKESLSRQSAIPDLPVINLSRVVREAAAMVVPLLEAQGRRLEVLVPDSLPVHGRIDDLRDLVRNLLDNALMHGRGTVTVRMRAPEPAAADTVEIEVSDEGEGVPRGQEQLVFERFRKLRSDTPGSGLGLAIVRQVARSHGGTVQFVPGRGCVRVSLPGLTAPRSLASGQ